MASVWPEPWRVMWAMASSSESTTRDGQDLVEVFGVPVGGLRGLHGRDESRGGGVAAELDPSRKSASAAWGGTAAAIAWCTSSVSAALQTPGRWTLALTMILTAISRSQRAST